ncbi:MAG: OmpA family protein [Bryobacteraceae bacterium]
MYKNLAALLALMMLGSVILFGQGLDTRGFTKDDWEEVNYEFNSAVLTDGFPSLLRLAELLQKNPGYKVKVEGHTDNLGSVALNEKLGMARANAVKDFLVKYGARPTQIDTSTRGKAQPRAAGAKPVYSKTDEARWMNRRVVITVMDDKGNTVSAGGPGDAIRAMQPQANNSGLGRNCCDEVLRRLDKLDEIAKMLKDLADQNAGLRREIDALKNGQQAMENRTARPAPMPVEQTPMRAAAEPKAPGASPFQLLGVNVGADQNGDVTFSGKGRFFQPFATHFALQAQGEYLYFKQQKEGQFDIGLVDRVGKRFQAGLFSSFKHVTLNGMQSGGNLGQASLTLDYLFKYGRIGAFGTKGFMDNAVINRANPMVNGLLANNVVLETYLKIVDQVGVSTTLPLWGRSYFEGNIGYLKRFGGDDRPGGTFRIVYPITNGIALTAEGGFNETLQGRDTSGRAVFGVQFGNFQKPREYLNSSQPVPVDVPRVRYDVLTRTIRKGNAAPIADAGPEQTGINAGQVGLDASASYDPDGDPITFQWTQEAGPAVTLSAPTAAKTTFTAVAGATYSFRVVVKDNFGATGAARVRVTAKAADRAQVLVFTASPTTIAPGQSATLSWRTLNADTVTITNLNGTGPTTVGANSSVVVAPKVTTTYVITAKNSVNEDSASVAVVVQAPAVALMSCFAQPSNITAGEASTLFWQSQGADTVTITPDIGKVGLSGSTAVSPKVTTTYIVTAVGAGGTATCSIGVAVTAPSLPRIIRFAASPATINAGEKSNLAWIVENATKVTIDGIGDVSITGSQDVMPTTTTTYNITATNAGGSVTAQTSVTVKVIPDPEIILFSANPSSSPAPGTDIRLTCTATNAATLFIAGDGPRPAPSTLVVVRPTVTTDYTCTANGLSGKQISKTITVTVGSTPTTGMPPQILFTGGSAQTTIFTSNTIDASGSYSPSGDAPLSFAWVARNNQGTIDSGQGTPVIKVTVPAENGFYYFDLTVTDSKGRKTVGTLTLQYKPIPSTNQ